MPNPPVSPPPSAERRHMPPRSVPAQDLLTPVPAPTGLLAQRHGVLVALAVGLALLAAGALVPGHLTAGSASLWIVLLTGLTAGGLSCLAVQGGLLATTVAQRDASATTPGPAGHAASPVIWFLVAKLATYTLLGALFGALGNVLQIGAQSQAVMQLAVGLFMLATAMHLLDVHPLFRYVVIQPPRFVTRRVRAQSRSGQAFGPAILGAMTVLLPCGVTQAMQLLAIQSASPSHGAAIMFTFVLGTSPLFFVLGYSATRLGEQLRERFLKLAAVAIIALAVLSLHGASRILASTTSAGGDGITLVEAQAPAAPANATREPAAPATSSRPPAASRPATPEKPQRVEPAGTRSAPAPARTTADRSSAGNAGMQEVRINVLDQGYRPAVVTIKSGKPARVVFVTSNTQGCTRSLVIGEASGVLPATGQTPVQIPAQQPGKITYTCGMGMYGGTIRII